ncbi:MAG: hypothetical protein JKY32_02450 [Rhizobiales bacterium]|nr:hypothetical protein [Hyphomicrobiales bacterium]
MSTTYPGKGAEDATAALYQKVGEIASEWTQMEDSMANLFYISISGCCIGQSKTYRDVFNSFRTYEPKMKMLNAAMTARYGENENIIKEWLELKANIKNAADFRNSIMHMTVSLEGETTKDAPARAKIKLPLMASFKKGYSEPIFDEKELTLEEVSKQWDQWQNIGAALSQFTMARATDIIQGLPEEEIPRSI